eukprot:scaffold186346_cov26-Tisochrysis_lutea.AAC.4
MGSRAKQCEDRVLSVGEHHVALVIQLDDEVMACLSRAAHKDDHAIGAKLDDLLDTLGLKVLPQLHREA